MPEISNTPYTMTPSQATQIVNSVGINPNDVLSAGNVAQTITAPVPKPDDLLGIRAAIQNELGVGTAQSAYDTAVGAVNARTGQMRSELQQLSNRPVSLSKITGQQAQLREVAGNEIQALSDSANLALQTLNAKKLEAETQFGIRESQISKIQTLQANFAGAGIKVSDSYDKAIGKIEKYTEEQEKKALKNALKETARSLGINTSGMSRKELEKAIAKKNQDALDMVKEKHELDVQTAEAQIAKLRSGGGGGLTEKEQLKNDQAEEKEFYKDVTRLQKEMSDEKSATNWDYSWNYLNNKYPGLDVNALDNALGLQYRDTQEEPGFWDKVTGNASNWWNSLFN